LVVKNYQSKTKTTMEDHIQFLQVLAGAGFLSVAKTLIDCMAEKDDPEAAKTFHTILATCVEHDFYVEEISAEIVTDLSDLMERTNVVPRYTLMKTKDGVEFGFCIIYEYTDVKDKAEIKYFFVRPECRRKGFAKEYFARIMPRYKSIYTDTSSENYVKLITGLGFRKVGKCKFTDEICYKWERPEKVVLVNKKNKKSKKGSKRRR